MIHQLKFFYIFILAFLVSCGTQAVDQEQTPVVIKPTKSHPVQPDEPLALKPEAKALLAALEKISPLQALFPTERIIELESTDLSLVAEVSDVILEGDHLLVLDSVQGLIFEFDQYGTFKKRFGLKGQGPGEYQTPIFMKRGYGRNVVVLDTMAGAVKVYDFDGNFVRESPRFVGRQQLFPRLAFSWKQKNRLYFGNFSTQDPDSRDHLILDTSADEIHGIAYFGQRHPLDRQLRKPRLTLTAFTEIDDKIWVGSQFNSYLEIYDREGTHLGHLGKRPRFGFSLTSEDWEETNLKDPQAVFKLLKRKKPNHCIHAAGGYVLVHLFPNLYEFYDRKGNLVRGNLASKGIFDILDTFEDSIVSILPEYEEIGRYNEDDLFHMGEIGWSREKLETANPYLRISTLVLELQ